MHRNFLRDVHDGYLIVHYPTWKAKKSFPTGKTMKNLDMKSFHKVKL